MKYYVEVDSDGSVFWHKDYDCKILHREDGPAVESANGPKSWWIAGKRHRVDGPAIEWANGNKHWYIDGKRHREDGPAIEFADGSQYWYINGKLHREDGPAVEFADGSKRWFLEGEELTEEEFNNRTRPVEELTVAQIEQLLGKRIKIVK